MTPEQELPGKAQTEYSIAWGEYRKSSDYQTSRDNMINKHMSQPYIDNILRCAFDAGYNSKPYKVRKTSKV